MTIQQVEYLEMKSVPTSKSIHKTLTEELNQAPLDFLKNVTFQLNLQQQHPVNDLVNYPIFFL